MYVYIYIYIYIYIHTYIYIYIYIYCRGKRLHTRNRHLRNHRGFPVAFSNGFSVTFSNGFSLCSGMFQRIVTFPVDLYRKCSMDLQHFPLDFHFCEFWCIIFCPEPVHPGHLARVHADGGASPREGEGQQEPIGRRAPPQPAWGGREGFRACCLRLM